MRIILSAIVVIHALLFMDVSLMLAVQGASNERFLYVVMNEVRLHKSPGMRTGIVAHADSGEICRYEYEIGEWILVMFPDGRQGFVHSSMVASYTNSSYGSLPAESDAGYRQEGQDTAAPDAASPPASAAWKWIAVLSLLLNLLFAVLLVVKWYEERWNAENYDKLRELAKIDESKETLKRELFLTMKQNQRLEEQVLRLKGTAGGKK